MAFLSLFVHCPLLFSHCTFSYCESCVAIQGGYTYIQTYIQRSSNTLLDNISTWMATVMAFMEEGGHNFDLGYSGIEGSKITD
ncbi:hypothetical protein WAI453_000241 [Rhynchosporium graminicola]